MLYKIVLPLVIGINKISQSEVKKAVAYSAVSQRVLFTDASRLALWPVVPASKWQHLGPFCGASFGNMMEEKPNSSLDY